MSQPCLPVSRRQKRYKNGKQKRLTIDFSSLATMDASEYLAMVSEQANNMPEVFIAPDSPTNESPKGIKRRRHPNAAIDGSAASLSYLVSSRASLTPPPTKAHLPQNSSWMNKTISNFERLRHYLEHCEANGIGSKMTNRLPVPAMKDRSGWHVFCVGEDEACGNVGSYYDDHADDDKDSTENATEKNVADQVPNWRESVPNGGHPPLIPLVLQMDQVMVRRVLSHLSHYVMEGYSPVSSQRSAWIYALLARLERPIHRDDAAVLFGLLKELTRVRAALEVVNKDRADLAVLDTLIVLIAIYFEQGGAGVMSWATEQEI